MSITLSRGCPTQYEGYEGYLPLEAAAVAVTTFPLTNCTFFEVAGLGANMGV